MSGEVRPALLQPALITSKLITSLLLRSGWRRSPPRFWPLTLWCACYSTTKVERERLHYVTVIRSKKTELWWETCKPPLGNSELNAGITGWLLHSGTHQHSHAHFLVNTNNKNVKAVRQESFAAVVHLIKHDGQFKGFLDEQCTFISVRRAQ